MSTVDPTLHDERPADGPGRQGPLRDYLTFDTLRDAYREQAEALIEADVDLILVETIFDTLNAKAAPVAIDEAFEARGVPRSDSASLASRRSSSRVAPS